MRRYGGVAQADQYPTPHIQRVVMMCRLLRDTDALLTEFNAT